MYKAISRNKRNTWILLFLFSIVATIIVIFFGMAFLELDLVSSAILGFVITFIYSLISFYSADKVALSSQGAKEVTKKEAYELYAMVENLCITAGLPVPKVYVIDDPSPNAFATGRDPEHASVAVTTGLLERLNKQELEGVLSHELGHIKNYDIRIMTIVVVLIGLIVLLSDILLRSQFYRRRGNRDNKIGLAILVVGLVLGILSPLFAQIIRLSISRTREYLADASGAMLTRHPEGLASALEKIASAPPLTRANHATAHLYISDPFKADANGKKRPVSFLSKLFNTHPPINDRIAKLRSM